MSLVDGRSRAPDLLIRGGYVLTMDTSLGDLPVGDVRLAGGRIAAVGPRLDDTGAEVVNASGAIVLPGFVDGHRHLWQSLLRGVAVDWSLPEYMVQARSLYCGCYDSDAAYLGNLLGGLESLAAGITTVVDHSHLQTSQEMTDALVRGLRDSGVGGVFAYALQNVPDYAGPEDPGGIEVDAVRDLLLRAPDDWHDGNARRVRDTGLGRRGRLRFGVALPEAAPYLEPAALRGLLARATALDPALLTGHWDGACEVLVDALADGPVVSLTHCNHVGDDDLARLARAGIGVCTTPDIECGMGLGPLVARRFTDLGGRASLGTDLSSYARADILAQARLLLQTERASIADDSGGPPPATVGWFARGVLDLVTQGAATSIGLGSEVGSLTVGKRGDVVVVRPDPLGGVPTGDPVATLLFSTSPAEVDTVVVEGEVVKRDGVMVGVDLADVSKRAADARSRIRERYRHLPTQAIQSVWAGIFG